MERDCTSSVDVIVAVTVEPPLTVVITLLVLEDVTVDATGVCVIVGVTVAVE